jgi:hypothetical protein
MRLCCTVICTFIFLIAFQKDGFTQDSTNPAARVTNFSTRFINKITNKAAKLDKRLTRQTEKYLLKLSKSEKRLKRKFYKMDSVAAKDLFSVDAADQYKLLSDKLKNDTASGNITTGEYLPFADSIKCLLINRFKE